MASVLPTRRPKLTLQINTAAVSPVVSSVKLSSPVVSKKSKPLPVHRFSYGSGSDSEDGGKFWSGEDASSAASSDDEDIVVKSPISKSVLASSENTVVLATPVPTSPFLPPGHKMRLPMPARAGMTKLRLVTAIPSNTSDASTMATPIVPVPATPFSAGPKPRQKLSLAIPAITVVQKRINVAASPVSAIAPASFRPFDKPSSSKPRKSVTFSDAPDVIISNEQYVVSNKDLLDFLASEERTEAELSEKWGLTVEESRMIGKPRNKKDRRERKWIGLTNSFLNGGPMRGDSDNE